MKNKILSKTRKIVAALLLATGIVGLYLARRDLRFGSFAKPQGGFAPTIFLIGLIIFSAINLVIELFTKDEIPEKLKDVNWLKWCGYVLVCGAYVFLLKKIGFLLDNFIALFAMIKMTGFKGLLKPAVVSAVFTVAVWALFTYAMNVKLPAFQLF